MTIIITKIISTASFGENSLNKTFTAGVVGICLIALLTQTHKEKLLNPCNKYIN